MQKEDLDVIYERIERFRNDAITNLEGFEDVILEISTQGKRDEESYFFSLSMLRKIKACKKCMEELEYS